MTAGTKIFLAVFALIVGILVVYYGVLVPGRNAALAVHGPANAGESDADKTREPPVSYDTGSGSPPRDVQPRRDSAPTLPQFTPASTPLNNASSAGGLLSEGMRNATGEDAVPAAGVGGQPTGQPVGQPAEHSAAGSFLPLIGLNAGDAQDHAGADKPLQEDRQPSAPAAPKSATPASSLPQPPPRTAYVIRTGDTFTSIAENWFGSAEKWSLIAKANPTVDPARLKVGQKIYLPAKDAAPQPAKAEPSTTANAQPTYVVQSGDTLMRIARNLYGDGAKWQTIYDLNRATIGKDPADLKVGMKLTLPKKPK